MKQSNDIKIILVLFVVHSKKKLQQTAKQEKKKA